MYKRQSYDELAELVVGPKFPKQPLQPRMRNKANHDVWEPVSYTHLRAHETVLDLVCRLLLENKHKNKKKKKESINLINR